MVDHALLAVTQAGVQPNSQRGEHLPVAKCQLITVRGEVQVTTTHMERTGHLFPVARLMDGMDGIRRADDACLPARKGIFDPGKLGRQPVRFLIAMHVAIEVMLPGQTRVRQSMQDARCHGKPLAMPQDDARVLLMECGRAQASMPNKVELLKQQAGRGEAVEAWGEGAAEVCDEGTQERFRLRDDLSALRTMPQLEEIAEEEGARTLIHGRLKQQLGRTKEDHIDIHQQHLQEAARGEG
mmetsp:Transcript_58724/g.130860  ORF Transcript_58724/g.130860 Transcript_58724/m.130860 type:complete len:240 (-) Transcript_58724:473-1192(-)|eukprot:CAMPEP_0181222166 /NCGR_PEP_ID=MMETSP1096-20121128/29815_1 /TAXON_ID=156174 ORGANISM="Chrysochromulina ericina, Strain CCMP281" /NCGR_SAMPLE_ID=MMETSP1096 /ASSEMBLY_ACC=CAM_ASM_000453 /LENGTH=239 /DNA_ID=CAMNT_0023314897 /DNA_START=382 /DNA_END=1101 /DNA_ORIENTATION=+